MAHPVYKRIVLKLSGEALQGKKTHGIDQAVLVSIAHQIKEIRDLRVDVAVVLGGGNIFRGQENTASRGLDMDRSVADYMGMLATVINGLALQDALEKMGMPTRVMTAIEMQRIAEPYIRRKAIRHLEKSRIVIFVAGTGNPYFTTDTTAALRAMEINDNSMGRKGAETLRKLQMAQYVETHKGQVCPASWEPGGDTLEPGLDLVGKL